MKEEEGKDSRRATRNAFSIAAAVAVSLVPRDVTPGDAHNVALSFFPDAPVRLLELFV